MNPSTPLRDLQNIYNEKKMKKRNFQVPPTPQTQRLGYGTGVGVYTMDRGSSSNQNLSPWALKKVERKFKKNKDISDRLKIETEVLKSLSHPNIIGFRGESKTKDGRMCLAMETCGKSLGEYIEERNEDDLGPFPAQNILKVAECLCSALHYLHQEKLLLHGDIKSYNVLIKGDFEQVKLCDFGTPIFLNDKGISVDEDQEYIGTDLWSAPEVLLDGIVTDKADIFAFGLTLWEMLALKSPNLPSLDITSSQESDCSVMEINDSLQQSLCLGQKPQIPEGLDRKYDFIISLIDMCTLEDCTQRPSAKELVKIIQRHKQKTSELNVQEV